MISENGVKRWPRNILSVMDLNSWLATGDIKKRKWTSSLRKTVASTSWK